MVNGRKLTDQQEKELCRRYRAGESANQIAPDYGVCGGTVLNILQRHNQRIRSKGEANRLPHRLTEEQEAEVCTRYYAGESAPPLAIEYGVSFVTIYDIIRRRGYTVRPLKLLTNRQEQEVSRLYRAGETIDSLAPRYDVHRSTIHSTLKRQQQPRRTGAEAHTIYQCNYRFFAEIASEQQAYWLGMIYSDGCVTDKNRLTIELQVRDKSHLEKLAAAMQSTQPILSYSRAPNKNNARFSVRSPQLVADLAQWGIVPRKTSVIAPPILPAQRVRHFWRGVVDGDGCLLLSRATRCIARGIKYYGPQMSIVGSWATCQGFAAYIQATLDLKLSVFPKADSRSWTVAAAGWDKAYRVAHLLYDKATVFLDRKMQTYQQMQAEVFTHSA